MSESRHLRKKNQIQQHSIEDHNCLIAKNTNYSSNQHTNTESTQYSCDSASITETSGWQFFSQVNWKLKKRVAIDTHAKGDKKNRFSCVMNRMEVVVFFLLNSICRLAFDGSADIDMVVLKQWTAESGLVVFENNHTATRACFGVSRFHTCQSQATKYIYIDFFFLLAAKNGRAYVIGDVIIFRCVTRQNERAIRMNYWLKSRTCFCHKYNRYTYTRTP